MTAATGRVLVVVQARLGSSRLPNKVLLPLAGKPLLQRMVERVLAAKTPVELVVATTTDAREQPIRDLCAAIGVRCFDGHPTDLLDRHYRAALAAGAAFEWVAKIPSDCPLIDPAIIDEVLAVALGAGSDVDFVTNLRPPTWPDGNDVELMRFSALEAAFHEATATHEREHTTPFIWDRPERFRLRNVRWATGLDLSASHRFTIDYEADYQLIAAIFDALHVAGTAFSLEQILELLEAHPELLTLNARHAGTSWHDQHAADLRTFSKRGGTQHFDE